MRHMTAYEAWMAEPTQEPLTLITGANVYAPSDLGKKDVLLGGMKVLGIYPPDTIKSETLTMPVTAVDARGLFLVPGFIDLHVHLTGGGGELGPESRTPEAPLSAIINAGVTTVVGTLGTDGTSRSLANLLVKARAIAREGGLTALMYTGAYEVPPPTITGSVRGDIMLIDQVIGVGEVAVSDTRSSAPTVDELARLASDARVAGMLSGKAGIVHMHMGKERSGLEPLEACVLRNIPRETFHPTHMTSRGSALIAQAKRWIQDGGTIDMTADDVGGSEQPTLETLVDWADRGDCDLARVTVSSDGYGSFPKLDAQGRVVGYGVGKQDGLLHTVKTLVMKHGWAMCDALQFVTSNPARVLKLGNKGKVAVGFDADLLLLSSTTLDLHTVFAGGKIVKTPLWVKKGMFEP